MLTRDLSPTEVAFELGDSALFVRTVYGHLVQGQTESKRALMDDPKGETRDKPAEVADEVA